MFLNEKQYKAYVKKFNDIVMELRDLQDKSKQVLDESEKTSFDKALYMGRKSGLEDAINALRREADISYQLQKVATDTELKKHVETIIVQEKAMTFLVDKIVAGKISFTQEDHNTILDLRNQFNLLRDVAANMNIILKNVE